VICRSSRSLAPSENSGPQRQSNDERIPIMEPNAGQSKAPDKSDGVSTPSKPVNAKPPDIASSSVPDTLAALHVNPQIGLTRAEVDVRRKEHGYNEVAEKKGRPVLKFLRKFWGISAWMLELIMVLSAVLGKFSDLAVVARCLLSTLC